MARKRSNSGDELNLDSLMDAVTNVVGVLMIVFVMVSLQVARTVKKILTDLPPVTPEQLVKIQEEIKAIPEPPKTPEQIAEEKKIAELELKKTNEQLNTIDLSDVQQKLKFMDLEDLRKQIEAKKTDRDKNRMAVEKLLAEVERLKALLDETPVYAPPPPTFVRLPNPRPYPEKPDETRILVAKEGVLFYRAADYMIPVNEGLERVKSQLTYRDVKVEPFAAMLEKILGSKAEVQKAWPEIAPLVNTFQMDLVAQAYKNLAAGGVTPSKDMLTSLGDLSIGLRRTLPEVAEAVAAATKGDLTKWIALDPSKDLAAPIIKAVKAGGKITFSYGAKSEEVRETQRDVLGYFKSLSDTGAFKNAGRNKTIYDAFKIVEMLKKAAASEVITKTYTMEPAIRPGLPYVQLALKPRAGGGESVEQMKQPNSKTISALRAIKANPNGVAVFQVMPDAIATYLDARQLADETGTPATWEFLNTLDLTANVTGFEVQRFTVTPPRPPVAAGTVPGVTIAPPKKTLD